MHLEPLLPSSKGPVTTPFQSTPFKAIVVGARGYSGLELVRLLLKHPKAELVGCFATSSFRLKDYLPERAAESLVALPVDQALGVARETGAGTVFLATPHEASADLAPKLLEAGLNVIDLSGAFRLKSNGLAGSAQAYSQWYSLPSHPALALVQKATYGLSPWSALGEAAAASEPQLVANPGCYATAALMGTLPLLKAGLIDPASIAIDGKSGTTGAGRKAEERLMHSEVRDECLAYKPNRHQHEPEIGEAALAFGGQSIDFQFVPHLMDLRRGIVATIYARASREFASLSAAELSTKAKAAFDNAYAEYPLVSYASLAETGASSLLSLRRVTGSARTQIAYQVADGGRFTVFCLIDNLMKGAASQAVENFNRLLALPVHVGLEEEGTL